MKNVKKVSLFVVLSAFLFLLTSTVYAANVSRSERPTPSRIYFEDDFSRSDSLELGSPWIEGNEHEEMDNIGSLLMGPAYLKLDNGTLAFHYNNHTEKTTSTPANQANNWRPYAYAPLSKSVRRFPVQMEFTFTPHADERIQHSVGLMQAEDEFVEILHNNHPIYAPYTGIGVHVGRTNRNYSNSDIRVYWYEDSIRTELYYHLTSFQFEAGEQYTVKVIVNRKETAVEISNGEVTETFTIETPNITFRPDQLFVADSGGGISSITPSSGDYLIQFDDFIVSYETWNNCDNPADRRCNPK